MWQRQIQIYVVWFQSNHCVSHFLLNDWIEYINCICPQTFHWFISVSGTYHKREIIHLLATVKLIWNILSPSPKKKNLFNFENLLIFMFNCTWLGFFIMSGLLRYNKNIVYVVILRSLTDWVFEYICNAITAPY